MNASGGAARQVEVVSERRRRPTADGGPRDLHGHRRADTATATHELTVRKPRLWDFDGPRTATPCSTELRVDGRDHRHLPHALRHPARSASTPTTASTLNGVYAKIQGVDLHHDLGALGAAVSADAIRAPDEDHEEHGRQRPPDLAQPARRPR